jgi:hypothetical protein
MKTKQEMTQIAKIVSKETGDKWKVGKMNNGEWFITNEDEWLYSEDLKQYDNLIQESIGTGKKVGF